MEMSQGTAGFGGGGGIAGMSSSIQSTTGGGLGEMGSYDGLPPSIIYIPDVLLYLTCNLG